MRLLAFTVGVLLCIQAQAGAELRVIDGVPNYPWTYGCGPTAAGMILGYWDGLGFDDLIDGVHDWDANRQAITNMIASPGHIRDYYNAHPDRTGAPEDPLHEDDCVADFMGASRFPLSEAGSSFSFKQFVGMAGYAEWAGYAGATGGTVVFDQLWDTLVEEVDAGRPMEFFVDTRGSGTPNHFVTVLGYDDSPQRQRYAAYNTYDDELHWYDFRPVGFGYGVQAGVSFCLDEQLIVSLLAGDFDGDGFVGAADIALLAIAIQDGNGLADCDLNDDGSIDWTDMEKLVRELVFISEDGAIRGTEFGDVNLDGTVNLDDFVGLKNSMGGSGPVSWEQGDFNWDGKVDLEDFMLLSQNFGFSSSTAKGAEVPEPTTLMLCALASPALFGIRRVTSR